MSRLLRHPAQMAALAVAIFAVAALVAAAPASAASSGDWSGGGAAILAPGSTTTRGIGYICASAGGCSYDNTLNVKIVAQSGLTFTPGTTPFLAGGATIGTCKITATKVVCGSSSSGTVANNAFLGTASVIQFHVASNVGSGVVLGKTKIVDAAGLNDPNTGNNTFTFYTPSTVGTPLVNVALLGGLGGGAGLALVIGGFLLINRRRRSGDVPTAAVPLG